jgi:hypothetical protein
MTDNYPAKRGFIAVTQRTRFVYSMIAGSGHRQSTNVGIVESVTRDGTVKRVSDLNGAASHTPRDWDTLTILDPAKLADPEAFLAECKRRQSTDPDKWEPFADLNDVRSLARKYARQPQEA